jgi:PAS domain S-box-containing protein
MPEESHRSYQTIKEIASKQSRLLDRLSTNARVTFVQKYMLTILFVALAAQLQWLLQTFGGSYAYILFYPAVMLAALIGGIGPGLLATVLSALSADYFFLQPRTSLLIANPADVLALAIFCFNGVFLTVIAQRVKKMTERARRESEERLRLAQQVADIGAFEWNIKTGAMRWTPRLEAMYGLPPGGFIGTQKGWEQLVHPEDRAEVVRRVRRSLETFQPMEGEWRVVWPDGNVHWLAGNWQVFKDGFGEPARMTGVNMDITERRKAEEAFRQSEEQQRTSFELSTVGMSQADPLTGRFLRVNNRLCEITGYVRDELLSKTVRDLTHPEDREAEWAKFERMLQGETDEYRAEKRYIRKDGQVIWVLVTARAIRNTIGKPIITTAIIIDITERKQAEEALRRSESSLAAAQRIAHIGSWEWEIVEDTAHWSDETFRMFGLVPGPMEKHRHAFLDLIHPEDRAGVNQALSDAVNGIKEYNPEYRIVRPDKTERTIHVLAEVIRTDDGRPVLMRGTVHDVTERKRMEEELRKSHDELELRVQERTEALRRQADLLELAHNAILVRDMENGITFWNRGAEEMYGWTRDEAKGAITHHLLKTRFPVSLDDAMTTLMSAGQWEGELEHTTKDGRNITVLSRQALQRDEAGNPAAIMEINLDITAAKRAEDQLRQSHKMEAIGTLAGGIAHDFNNMLAVIIGNAELALDDVEEPGPKRNLDQILKAAERSRDLVKQILTFSRRSTGQGKAVKIVPLLRETYRMLRASLPSTIRMNLRIRTKSVTILADPSLVQQVVVNLANNAAHAMQENGGTLTIGLSSITLGSDFLPDENMRPGRYLKLTVEDTGTGIAPDEQKRIFEPFFTTKGIGQGTGMGLAVVYGIVRGYNGMIEVESKVGKGSKFTVLLPQADASSTIWEEEEKKEEVSPCPRKEHVLFVDDEPGVMETTKTMLERIGCSVTALTDSSEALRMFTEKPGSFDLIITDQTMPDMDGLALTRGVLAVRKDMPVILCTGYSETVSQEKAIEAGVREFVMKPITKKEMAQAIRRVLEHGEDIK